MQVNLPHSVSMHSPTACGPLAQLACARMFSLRLLLCALPVQITLFANWESLSLLSVEVSLVCPLELRPETAFLL